MSVHIWGTLLVSRWNRFAFYLFLLQVHPQRTQGRAYLSLLLPSFVWISCASNLFYYFTDLSYSFIFSSYLNIPDSFLFEQSDNYIVWLFISRVECSCLLIYGGWGLTSSIFDLESKTIVYFLNIYSLYFGFIEVTAFVLIWLHFFTSRRRDSSLWFFFFGGELTCFGGESTLLGESLLKQV